MTVLRMGAFGLLVVTTSADTSHGDTIVASTASNFGVPLLFWSFSWSFCKTHWIKIEREKDRWDRYLRAGEKIKRKDRIKNTRKIGKKRRKKEKKKKNKIRNIIRIPFEMNWFVCFVVSSRQSNNVQNIQYAFDRNKLGFSEAMSSGWWYTFIYFTYIQATDTRTKSEQFQSICNIDILYTI